MDDTDRAREWLEWVYANGRGASVDHARNLIEILDDQPWFSDCEQFTEDMADAIDWPEPKTGDLLQLMGEHIERELVLLDDIRATLTEAGAIDKTSDIPKTLRLLLGP